MVAPGEPGAVRIAAVALWMPLLFGSASLMLAQLAPQAWMWSYLAQVIGAVVLGGTSLGLALFLRIELGGLRALAALAPLTVLAPLSVDASPLGLAVADMTSLLSPPTGPRDIANRLLVIAAMAGPTWCAHRFKKTGGAFSLALVLLQVALALLVLCRVDILALVGAVLWLVGDPPTIYQPTESISALDRIAAAIELGGGSAVRTLSGAAAVAYGALSLHRARREAGA